MRRELVVDVGGYDPDFRLYEDWEIWVNALAHGWRGVRVDAVTHEYRRARDRSSGATGASTARCAAQLRDKHAGAVPARGGLAGRATSALPGGSLYRWFWGPRPVPARFEHARPPHCGRAGVFRTGRA